VLILEDDITLADDFAERFPRFVASVPDDWQGIYLGAEHKDPNTDLPMPPTPIAPGIARCRMPMRTHAYGVRGPLLTRLTTATERHRWHIDHAIGAVCGEFPVYCADPPLVGQRAGGSDVGQGLRATPEFWG
jgi:hypothetical protein